MCCGSILHAGGLLHAVIFPIIVHMEFCPVSSYTCNFVLPQFPCVVCSYCL